ncbi:ABC transporter ATP-binding protein [Paenarthrobacter sp. DKR-5]|uniref:ABC transporter ATP-binding protein n=1 Tax=Paenarthrobacter sp. DKR-5 TaxID=2835535 RepID=UPI001BDCC832|nr:ABC transporter ATP-binding protein [Paenarthrobacter sp. DKR-5]MBT1002586.1 ABC transporter ATP-binding protein [Paenarthrobacter sp. DKR-5]
MASITTNSLVKEYPGGVRGVDEMDVTINDGEFFALLGPSGCGKTTLLRTIAGLEKSTSGSIRIGDREVTNLEPGQRRVAMVFQDYALFPHMSIADNISYPLKIQKVSKQERRTSAEDVGGKLSLQGLLERRPGQLSGGQQQRVALARAVSSRPDVFLFDEPLSNLDARLRLEARTFLKKLQLDLGVTTVFVTHDQAEALALADRIAVMRSGKLQQLGTPREVFQRPANTFVASFVGSTPMNLLEGTVRDGQVQIGNSAVPLPQSAAGLAGEGQTVTWGARPEYLDVATSTKAGSLAGSVTVSENLGAAVLLTVQLDGHDQDVQVVVGEDFEPAIGTSVWVTSEPRRTLLFDSEGLRIGD